MKQKIAIIDKKPLNSLFQATFALIEYTPPPPPRVISNYTDKKISLFLMNLSLFMEKCRRTFGLISAYAEITAFYICTTENVQKGVEK